jgi:Nif-specific regulatory protein
MSNVTRSDPTFSASEAATVTASVTAPPASHERQVVPQPIITTKQDPLADDLDPLRDHDLDLAFHELGLDPLILPGEARPFCSHVWKISSLPQKPSTYPGLAMNSLSEGAPNSDQHPHDQLVLRSERDLYRKLLELGTSSELEPFLREALELVTRVCGARCGYLELRHEGSPGTEIAASSGLGLSSEDLDAVRTMISRGVIAEAMASGRTVETASALDDPRFERRESVKANRIEAVLCVPVGSEPPLGVLYLQDRLAGGRFATEDRSHAELVARHIAPYGERLLLRKQVAEVRDFTSTYRASLDLTKIAGRSEAMGRLLREVSLVASRNITVLLTGPSGCGKTQLARSIHANGPRPNGPFVELNCATLPESLVESELFGALPGAHSTATRRIPGKVEAAEGGTLFLDEIGELPLGAQAKLLQLLQSFEYFPLGATKAVKVDLRVIAATNTDLRAAVTRKAFREDLLYRLEVVPIRVPPLAARRDDIRELMEVFCRRAAETHKLGDLQLSPGVVRAAEVADWPGNVRQLENAVEAACIRAAGRESLRVELEDMFPDDINQDNKTMSDSKSGTTDTGGDSTSSSGGTSPPQETFQAATRRFHAQLLLRTLEETDWNVVETARRLDVTRSHVYNLIRAHGIERAPRSK